MENNEEIFVYLVKTVNCSNISDLHSSKYINKAWKALMTLNKEEFSLNEYNEAIKYLTGNQIEAGSKNEVDIIIESQLKKNL